VSPGRCPEARLLGLRTDGARQGEDARGLALYLLARAGLRSALRSILGALDGRDQGMADNVSVSWGDGLRRAGPHRRQTL
jgi:hypothetical protein